MRERERREHEERAEQQRVKLDTPYINGLVKYADNFGLSEEDILSIARSQTIKLKTNGIKKTNLRQGK